MAASRQAREEAAAAAAAAAAAVAVAGQAPARGLVEMLGRARCDLATRQSTSRPCPAVVAAAGGAAAAVVREGWVVAAEADRPWRRGWAWEVVPVRWSPFRYVSETACLVGL